MHVLIIPSEHFITQTQPLGGIFQYHQAKALSNAGHQIGIISVGYITPRYLISNYIYKKEEEIDSINIKRYYKQLYFPHRYIPFKILKSNYIKMADKLYSKYIKEFGIPDIIHAHNFLYAGIIAEFLKNKYGINYIITEHSTAFARGLVNNQYDLTIQSCYKNASVSTSVSTPFKKLLIDKTKTNIELLSNIVDSFFFEKEFKNLEKRNFTFFNVASLDDKKNHTILLETFANLFIGSPVKLNIAGDGPLEFMLKEKVKNLNIKKQVNFLGRISQERVRDEMMNSDCFVLSSNFETFGVVLIEALACGLPLIATKCGGPEDIVNEQNGILIDIGNQLLLEDAMMTMYKNANKYDKEKLRNDVKEKFGEKAFVRNVMKYYEVGIK